MIKRKTNFNRDEEQEHNTKLTPTKAWFCCVNWWTVSKYWDFWFQDPKKHRNNEQKIRIREHKQRTKIAKIRLKKNPRNPIEQKIGGKL